MLLDQTTPCHSERSEESPEQAHNVPTAVIASERSERGNPDAIACLRYWIASRPLAMTMKKNALIKGILRRRSEWHGERNSLVIHVISTEVSKANEAEKSIKF